MSMGHFLQLLCCFTVVAAIRDGDERGGKKNDPIEPTAEEVTAVKPIPGSQTWYSVNKLSKNVHTCGGSKQYCCIRGCRYLVEKDACGECQGHNVQTLSPQEEVNQYQSTMQNVRIPTGIDYPYPVRGCWKKNAVTCTDKDSKKACCCNLGFIFDFNTRQCISDPEDVANKEEPIPGTEFWGLIWGHGRKKVTGNAAKKCAWHPKKWCCNRGCEYMLDQDKCGKCSSYADHKPTPPKEVIKKFIAENGNYVVPRSIAKPRGGVCAVKNAKKCVAQGSTVAQCCCHAGFYFSFASRRCLEPAQQQKELQEDEAEDEAAAAAASGSSEAVEVTQGGSTLKSELARDLSGSEQAQGGRGGAGRTCLSIGLLFTGSLLWC